MLQPATSDKESPVMTVWPGIGSRPQPLGRLHSGSRIGYGFFTLGKIWALVSIPVSIVVYLWRLLPGRCRRYALTNQRVIVRLGLTAKAGPSMAWTSSTQSNWRSCPARNGCILATWFSRRTARRSFACRAFPGPKVSRPV